MNTIKSLFRFLWKMTGGSLFVIGLCVDSLNSAVTPQIANYTIDARLNPEEKSLAGKEVLIYINASQDTLRELQFHLYMNAFRDNRSTFMKEADRFREVPELKGGKEGSIDITKIIVADSIDLSNALQFIQPDDGNVDDRTVARLPITRPVFPNDSVKVYIEFSVKIPRVLARTGYFNNFFFIAQWFPKIGVYQNGSWNCHQFHARSEFFADFGTYDVQITVPNQYKVGSTGQQVSKQNNSDGTITYRFQQANIHDFAWTACPDFIQKNDTFSFSGSPDITIQILMQPEHEWLWFNQGQRYLKAVRASLEYCAKNLAPYPYQTITVVDPPVSSKGFGGMEYPTIIVAGTRMLAPRNFLSPEGVTVHEFMHQYFYGMAASNEFEEAWLDEGLTTYFTGKILEDAYPPLAAASMRIAKIPVPGYQLFEYYGIPIMAYWGIIPEKSRINPSTSFYKNAGLDPIVKYSWKFYNDGSYVNSAYTKPAMMLRTIENYIGKEKMRDLLQTYFLRWQFKHPTTKDFLAVVEEKSSPEVVQFVQDMLFGVGTLDYAVGILSADSLGKESPGMFKNVVTIRRIGSIVFPVEIRVVFENGEVITERWDGKSQWIDFPYTKPSRVISATVDPDNKLTAEYNVTNNSMRRTMDCSTPLRWASQWLFWVQTFLLEVGFFL